MLCLTCKSLSGFCRLRPPEQSPQAGSTAGVCLLTVPVLDVETRSWAGLVLWRPVLSEHTAAFSPGSWRPPRALLRPDLLRTLVMLIRAPLTTPIYLLYLSKSPLLQIQSLPWGRGGQGLTRNLRDTPCPWALLSLTVTWGDENQSPPEGFPGGPGVRNPNLIPPV